MNKEAFAPKFDKSESHSNDETPHKPELKLVHSADQLPEQVAVSGADGRTKELIEARKKFDEDIKQCNTFQELIWRVQEEKYYRSLDAVEQHVTNAVNDNEPIDHAKSKDAIANIKFNATIVDDLGEDWELGRLEMELQRLESIDLAVGNDKAIGSLTALGAIPGLQQKALELRDNRRAFSKEYRQERPYRIVPGGDFIPVHAITKEKVESIRTVTDDVPVVVAPGFSVNPYASEWDLVGFAEEGRPALTYDVDPHIKDFDATLKYPKDTPTLTKIRVSALKRALEAGNEIHGDTKYDIVAYSQGAIDTITLATLEPEKFRNIILLNPAGMVNLDDPYLKRFWYLFTRSAKHKEQVKQQAEAGKKADERHYEFHKAFSAKMDNVQARGGLPFAVETGSAIAQAKLVEGIKEATAKGVRIVVLTGSEDPLFPKEEIKKYSAKAGVTAAEIPGGHANVGFDPGAVSSVCTEMYRFMNEGDEPVTAEVSVAA